MNAICVGSFRDAFSGALDAIAWRLDGVWKGKQGLLSIGGDECPAREKDEAGRRFEQMAYGATYRGGAGCGIGEALQKRFDGWAEPRVDVTVPQPRQKAPPEILPCPVGWTFGHPADEARDHRFPRFAGEDRAKRLVPTSAERREATQYRRPRNRGEHSMMGRENIPMPIEVVGAEAVLQAVGYKECAGGDERPRGIGRQASGDHEARMQAQRGPGLDPSPGRDQIGQRDRRLIV